MNKIIYKLCGNILILCLGLSGACYSMAGDTTGINQATLLQQLQSEQKPLIIDVRTPQEYSEGHVPSAINIPHTEIAARLGEISSHKDQPVVLYCKTGRRAAMAAETLHKSGFSQLRHLEGDMEAWKTKELPQEQ